jgi:polynucleotide 5'-hydroxyl-kinase GRC3/NOL9
VEGTAALAAGARRRGARIVVVDTTGWVEGPSAVAAKLRKIRRLAPRHVVAIQRAAEVEPILAGVPAGTVIHRLRPAAAARTRTAAERRAFREERFAVYFAHARPLVLDTRRLTFARAVLFQEIRLAPGRVLAEMPPAALRHLLVGLAGRRGRIMAMGTVSRSTPALHRLAIIAPGVAPDAVRSIAWGVLRVAPWGREEGRLSDTAGAAS